MPTYEVEMNGKSYEVDAPSIEAFSKAYQGGAGQGDFFHPVKPAAGSGWRGALERITQYPRIFLGDVLDAGETLGKVSRGELDAAHPDAIKAASTIAQVGGPAGEFAGTGAQITRRALSPGGANPAQVVPSAGMQAAQTAVDVGSPLPAGIVSETPGVKAFTQGFRQVPFVGPGITEKVGETVKHAGGRVGGIAEELSGGPVADRATVGASTKDALEQVIQDNKSKIDDAYSDLRTNHINPDAMASLPRTESALKGILRDRGIAGMVNPESGLGDIANLVDKGTSFNGLQRARSDIGSQIDADTINPHPGFHGGDMKLLYRAMTADMEGIARYHAINDPEEAAAAFRSANSTAQDLINRNTTIGKLIGKAGNDQGMLGRIINAGREKTGNARLLAHLRQQMPAEDFNRIAGIALDELGRTDQGFSLNRFSTGWGGLSPSAKSVLFADPAHRKALDDIANLGSFLKDADKYRNTSNTAHAGGVIGGLMTIFEAAKDPEKIPAILGGLAGGYGISKVLARPASASALRKWLTVAKDKASGRYGPAKASAALALATRNLQNNLPESAQAEPAKREPLRVTVHPKSQSRAPSGGAYPQPLQP